MPVHIRPRTKVVPPARTAWPCSTLFVYAMTRPRSARRPAYAASWRSNARQAAPIERAAQSDMRAGSTRITPIVGSRFAAGSTSSSSVGLVEVAALQEVEVAVIVLDVEMQLEVVLHDLRRGVALRSGVVGKREDDELGILAADGLETVRVAGGLRGILRHHRHE